MCRCTAGAIFSVESGNLFLGDVADESLFENVHELPKPCGRKVSFMIFILSIPFVPLPLSFPILDVGSIYITTSKCS
jgi:hypothetical protein